MQTSFDWPSLTRKEEEIFERLLLRTRNYRHSESQLMESIDEADRCRLYERFNKASLQQFCVEVLGLGEDTAYYFRAVVRKARTFPELKDAIASGETTVSKVARIVSVMTVDNKDEWIEKAKTLSKEKLRREVAKVSPKAAQQAVVRPKGEDLNRVAFDANDEFVELLKRAKDVLKTSDESEVLRAALKELLKHKDPVAKAERARKSARAEKSSDAIPAASKHAVNKRDLGRCQERGPSGEVCGKSRYVEIHHVKRRADGGSHDPENLITLCGFHHRQRHEVDRLTI